PNVTLSEAARRLLLVYNWPGNARELRNALERAVVFSHADAIEPESLPETVQSAAVGAAGAFGGLRSLGGRGEEVIGATLEATHYQISRSAEILGISRKTLLEKRKKYGLK